LGNTSAGSLHYNYGESHMTDQCYVVAFDPGQTTGWCVLGVEKETLLGARHVNDRLHEKLTWKEYGQIGCLGPQNGWDANGATSENYGVDHMLDIVNEHIDCAIVFEDFILDFNQATMSRSTLSPVTVMAKFEMGFQYVAGDGDPSVLGRIFRQNRSPVKTTMTDVRLRNLKLYDMHSGQHARDAMRHAYYFLRNCRGSSIKARELRWRAWPGFFNDPMSEDIKNDYYKTQERRKGTRIERLG
jgi:hypothetical protein